MKEEVPAPLDGERLDRVVAMITGRSRGVVAELLSRGAVRLGGEVETRASRRVRQGDVVEADLPPAARAAALVADPAVAVPVVHADGDIVVVDKPPGMVVHPGAGHDRGTLVHGLLARFPDLAAVGEADRPGIVHRLDRGTSGLLVVARTDEAYRGLVQQLTARTVDRRYTALVLGHVATEAGLVDAPIGRDQRDPTRMTVATGGREARTRYAVVARYDEPLPATELECRLETGRTHQIRVHLAAIGHPVAGDERYGGDRPALAVSRPFLHAHHLAFDHPRGGHRATYTSGLPADLEAVRGQLR